MKEKAGGNNGNKRELRQRKSSQQEANINDDEIVESCKVGSLTPDSTHQSFKWKTPPSPLSLTDTWLPTQLGLAGLLFKILNLLLKDDLRRHRMFPLVPQQELWGVRHVKAGGHRHHVLRPRHCRRVCGRPQSSSWSEVDNLEIGTARTSINIYNTKGKKTPKNYSSFLEGTIFQYLWFI